MNADGAYEMAEDLTTLEFIGTVGIAIASIGGLVRFKTPKGTSTPKEPRNLTRQGGRSVATNSIRSLDDLNSIRGASWEEAEKLIPSDWLKGPLNKGEGVKYINPHKRGEQILLERGNPMSRDPLHQGPYIKVSRNGEIVRIPLEGNPTLQ